MDKLRKRTLIYLILGIFSAVSAVGGTAALALSALKGYYILCAVLVLVAGHGFYGTVFYFRAYRAYRAMQSCLVAYDSGARASEDIAAQTGLTVLGAEKFMERIFSLGILKREGENT